MLQTINSYLPDKDVMALIISIISGGYTCFVEIMRKKREKKEFFKQWSVELKRNEKQPFENYELYIASIKLKDAIENHYKLEQIAVKSPFIVRICNLKTEVNNSGIAYSVAEFNSKSRNIKLDHEMTSVIVHGFEGLSRLQHSLFDFGLLLPSKPWYFRSRISVLIRLTISDISADRSRTTFLARTPWITWKQTVAINATCPQSSDEAIKIS